MVGNKIKGGEDMDFNFDIAKEIFYKNAVLRKSYKELSKEYNLDSTTICRRMKKFKKSFGIKDDEIYCLQTYLRYAYGEEIRRDYLSGISTVKIAERFKTTDNLIAKVLRGLGVEIRPAWHISKTNQTLFKNITNEIEAYTLGLITSDGNIDRNGTIRIFLTESDKYILEEINSRLLNGTGNLAIDRKQTCKGVARLGFCGKAICKNLAQYNVVPNKSDFLTDIYILPEGLMHHYIRGLFDGDGVASKSGPYIRVGFCAKRKEFVESYQSFLCETLFMRKNKIFNTGGCFQCSWGAKADVEKFYNYIYKDATIFLGRKKNKIYTYLNK